METCKVLGESTEFEDEDLNMNDNDAEEATMDELNERDAAAQIQARPEYAEEVADAATHFKHTIYKLREISKVRGCNTQNQPILLVEVDMCVTCRSLADMFR